MGGGSPTISSVVGTIYCGDAAHVRRHQWRRWGQSDPHGQSHGNTAPHMATTACQHTNNTWHVTQRCTATHCVHTASLQALPSRHERARR
eukprot:gene9912-biopygen3755